MSVMLVKMDEELALQRMLTENMTSKYGQSIVALLNKNEEISIQQNTIAEQKKKCQALLKTIAAQNEKINATNSY